ncbi:hypothetical protein Cyagr_1252 [Cyanobium gracile PCC 6307]|uniref:Uncharacterized protein n=1 Tax=Cyanobium gracile (strain ATCC 27147 / PCC 6307) TaxID=292564 RepID=K9P5P4_CYAGP|nr:hypothetical protein Cyagr_1252 [Cyanobium gracile PCC 6307]
MIACFLLFLSWIDRMIRALPLWSLKQLDGFLSTTHTLA